MKRLGLADDSLNKKLALSDIPRASPFLVSYPMRGPCLSSKFGTTFEYQCGDIIYSGSVRQKILLISLSRRSAIVNLALTRQADHLFSGVL